jgi:hypothetical protein
MACPDAAQPGVSEASLGQHGALLLSLIFWFFCCVCVAALAVVGITCGDDSDDDDGASSLFFLYLLFLGAHFLFGCFIEKCTKTAWSRLSLFSFSMYPPLPLCPYLCLPGASQCNFASFYPSSNAATNVTFLAPGTGPPYPVCVGLGGDQNCR